MTRNELRQKSERMWAESDAALARHYDVEAEIANVDGDAHRVEWCRALAACYRKEPGAEERKDRARAAMEQTQEAA